MYLMNRCDIGSDGKTPTHTMDGFAEKIFVHACTIPSWSIRWNSSSEAAVVTEQGSAIKTRAQNVRKIPESENWDADQSPGMRAVPWSPDGSDNALEIQVGMEVPAEMVPRPLDEVLMENKVGRTYIRRADFDQWGLGVGCPGCRYLRTGKGRQQTPSEACDSSGSARLSATDESIVYWPMQLNDTRPRIKE